MIYFSITLRCKQEQTETYIDMHTDQLWRDRNLKKQGVQGFEVLGEDAIAVP